MMKNTTKNNNQEVKGQIFKSIFKWKGMAIICKIVLIVSICNLLLLIITF